MARTREGSLLTNIHMRQQLGLRAATVRDIIKLYPMWTLSDPASYERFVQAVTLLTQQRSTNSAALAARYYELFKNAEGMTAGIAATITAPPSSDAIRVAINATARAGVYRALAAGKTVDQAMKSGLVQVSGSVARQVLNGGRETILDAVREGDARGKMGTVGWIRVSDGDPCAFCSMLLSRGPEYLSFETAGNKSDASPQDFDWHDACGCSVEPFFEGSEWPDKNRQLRGQWDASTGGHSGNDALNAFRRSLTGSEE